MLIQIRRRLEESLNNTRMFSYGSYQGSSVRTHLETITDWAIASNGRHITPFVAETKVLH